MLHAISWACGEATMQAIVMKYLLDSHERILGFGDDDVLTNQNGGCWTKVNKLHVVCVCVCVCCVLCVCVWGGVWLIKQTGSHKYN